MRNSGDMLADRYTNPHTDTIISLYYNYRQSNYNKSTWPHWHKNNMPLPFLSCHLANVSKIISAHTGCMA